MTTAAERRPTVTSAPLLVVATFYCTPKSGAPFYELHLAARPLPVVARGMTVVHARVCNCLVLRTRDEQRYQDALDLEDSPHRVIATWHGQADGRWLDTLEL